MCVEREHLFQVLKHVIKKSATEVFLMELPPVSIHGLLVGLEVAVKVSLLVALILGVKVMLVALLVAEMVEVFESVIKVKGVKVLSEVIVVVAASSVALSWQWAMAKLVILPSPLVIR